MSLNRYPQPLQSPLDYRQSSSEIEATVNQTKQKSSIIRYLWSKFGHTQVGHVETKAEGFHLLPLPDSYYVDNMKMVNEDFVRHVARGGTQPGCKCVGNEPFSCTLAVPQNSGAHCPPWHGQPTQLYLYNGAYLCCAQSPYGADNNHMSSIRQWQSSLNGRNLSEAKDIDFAYNTQAHKVKQVLGNHYQPKFEVGATRVITS